MVNCRLGLTMILAILFVTNSGLLGGGRTRNHWFDNYGKISWKEEVWRLRNFEIYLRRNPDAIGYIGFNWSSPEEYEEMEKRAQRDRDFLIRERKLDSQRIIIVKGGPRENPRIVLHILPKDAEVPDFS